MKMLKHFPPVSETLQIKLIFSSANVNLSFRKNIIKSYAIHLGVAPVTWLRWQNDVKLNLKKWLNKVKFL